MIHEKPLSTARALAYVLALLACYAALQWHDAYTEQRIAEHDRATHSVSADGGPATVATK